jgi:uncharacterized protein (DUF3084 family)
MADDTTMAAGTLQVALTLRKEMGTLAEQTRKDRQTAVEQAEASTRAASAAGDYLSAVEQKVAIAEGIEGRVGTIGAVETRTAALEEEAVPAIAGRATALEGRATALEAAETALGGRATALEGRATSLEAGAVALAGRQDDVEDRAAAVEARATAVETAVSEVGEDADDARQRATLLDERANLLEARAQALESRTDAVEDTALPALAGRATALETAAASLGGRATAVEGRATALEDRADDLEAGTTSLGGRATALEGRADTIQDTDLPALQGRATSLEGRADSLEGRAAALETATGSLVPAAESLAGRATSLEGRAGAVEGRATALEGRTDDLEGAATSLAGRATSLEERSLELEEDRDLLDGRMTAADERANAFDDRTNALEGRATAVEAAATALDGRATTVESRATSLEGRAESLEGRATSVEGAASALDGRATAVEGRATAVEGRATVLEGTSTRLDTRTRRQQQQAVTWSMYVPAALGFAAVAVVTVGANGRVVDTAVAQSAYEARVAPLETAATDVAGRATSLEGRAAALEDDRDLLAGRATALEGRAAAVETDAAALRRATAGVAGQLSFSMWVPGRPGVRVLSIGGNGQEITALAGAADVAALEERVNAARKTAQFFIWLPKQQFPQSVYYVGNNGRQLAFDAGGGSGGDGPGLLKLNYVATVGSNYTTTPTISLWDTTTIYGGSLWGQSFANAGLRPGDVAYSTSPRDPDWALMPSAGIAPGGSNFDAFVPLYSDLSGGTGETILPEMLHHVLAGIHARTGERRQIVGRVHAHSGQPYYALMRGTNVLNQWRQGVRNCVIAAKAQGKSYVEAFCCVLHGEADHSVPWWQMVQNMLQLSRDMTAAAQAETGQTQPVVLILQFPNRSAVTGTVRQSGPNIAYRWLCDHYPHLFVGASPSYGIRQHETDSHPVVDGYRMHGRLFAPAVVGAIAGTGWVGTRAHRFWQTGTSTGRIEVLVPLGGSLVRDESGTLVGYDPDPESPHYIGPPPEGEEATGRDGGIRARDLVGGNNGIVSAVVSGNFIDVTAHRAWGPPGSNFLLGGCRPTGASIAGNNEEMGRTVFRNDTAYTLTDTAELCHHWLEPFELRW